MDENFKSQNLMYFKKYIHFRYAKFFPYLCNINSFQEKLS